MNLYQIPWDSRPATSAEIRRMVVGTAALIITISVISGILSVLTPSLVYEGPWSLWDGCLVTAILLALWGMLKRVWSGPFLDTLWRDVASMPPLKRHRLRLLVIGLWLVTGALIREIKFAGVWLFHAAPPVWFGLATLAIAYALLARRSKTRWSKIIGGGLRRAKFGWKLDGWLWTVGFPLAFGLVMGICEGRFLLLVGHAFSHLRF